MICVVQPSALCLPDYLVYPLNLPGNQLAYLLLCLTQTECKSGKDSDLCKFWNRLQTGPGKF